MHFYKRRIGTTIETKIVSLFEKRGKEIFQNKGAVRGSRSHLLWKISVVRKITKIMEKHLWMVSF